MLLVGVGDAGAYVPLSNATLTRQSTPSLLVGKVESYE